MATHKKGNETAPPPGKPQPFDFQTRRNRRLIPFVVITLVGFSILISQLFMEQLVNREEHLEREKQQTMRRILLPGPRGNILDRNGDLLVGNRARFSAAVFLNSLRKEFRTEYLSRAGAIKRQEAETGEEVDISNNDLIWNSRMAVIQYHLDEISRILGRPVSITRRELESHFNNRILLPLKLVSDLSEEEYARLVDQLPPNSPVHVWTESARYYPYGNLAAHTLGYVVSREVNLPEDEEDNSELMTFSYYGKVGKAGVERSFEELLDGKSGQEVWRVDPQGFQYERLSLIRPEQGEDLNLSIDVAIQQAAQRGLEGKVGAAVAMNPKTGEVLALASSPTYDLNDLTPYIPSDVYREIDQAGGWLNRAIQGLYPPGSTFKPVTAIAAFRKGVLEPYEILFCGSSYRVGNRNFPEHSNPGFGEIALPRALAVSSNVFFYQIGLRAGIDWIADTARLFGMDKPTGIELPFETSREIVPDRQWKKETQGTSWFPGDTANTSIGQGFLRVTPLNMAVVAAGLASGKTGIRPTLVRRDDGWTPDYELKPLPLTQEEYGSIVEGMIRAVEEGTARRTRFTDLTVAGKTGTAQVYPDGKALTLAWFIGFAPVEDPEIAVAVVVEGVSADDQYHGGTTAAPVAREIFQAWQTTRPIR
ncbi:penicillin-binding protein 2 [Puniceicoccus vermicola]|uniref:Penicillin-binding protein 2 n=1 Tax=Puniceicoccus vermicola TaxID=388746 RepID=A0A7X1AWX6_9BACT|nr:penicillin-binding protein 2 [Puniceicoccus vermicola]MBC2601437.1 penicillin-binding protein 2 [Puniceicoccus vermicola]